MIPVIPVDALIEQCSVSNVPAWIVKGIIQIESNRRPLAINVNYPKKNGIKYVPQSDTLKGATKTANGFLNKGMTVSAGLMQVSSQNFKAFNMTLKDAFTPCKNIKAGSMIFREAYKITSVKYKDKRVALDRALSLYNSGSETIGLPYAARFRKATNTKRSPVMLAMQSPKRQPGLSHSINEYEAQKVLLSFKAPTKQQKLPQRNSNPQRVEITNPYKLGTRIMSYDDKAKSKITTRLPFTNATTRIDLSVLEQKTKDSEIEGSNIAFEPHEAEEMGAFEEKALDDE